MMAGAAVSPEPTYGVKIHGRLYPHHLRESTSVGSSSTRPSETPPATRTTKADLTDSIWRRLPFPDTECAGKKQLLEAYADSVALLQDYHAELDELFRLLCRTNFTATHVGKLQKDVMGKERKRILQAMYRHGDLKPLRVENVVDAHLVSKPTEVVQQQLTSSLRRMTKRLVAQVFRTFDRLTDRSVSGVIEWTSDTTCKFHYFAESLTQTYEGPSTVTSESRQGDTVEVITRHRRSGENIHVRARHEHHLIEARKHSIGDPTVPIPKKYQEFVVAIPGWLRPIVRVVTGTQIRADVVEQERRENRWLEEVEVVESRTFRVHYDPAIVMDDYVLTAWDQQDIAEDERQRENELAEIRFAAGSPRRRAAILCGALLAVLLQVAALVLTIRGTERSPAFLLVGLLVALLGLFPAWMSGITTRLQQGRTVRQQDYINSFLLVGSLGAAVMAAHLSCAAWILANWQLACLGGLAAILTCITEVGRRNTLEA